MVVLIFSQWSIAEGITHGAVFPIVNAISRRPEVEKILLCTLEVGTEPKSSMPFEGVEHIPIDCRTDSTVGKSLNTIRIPRLLSRVVKEHRVDFVWCKGAPAGGYVAILNQWTGVPFVVDSLEPHSEYMVESGTWSRLGVKYFVQRVFERMAIRRASALLPVSTEYMKRMVKEGVPHDKLSHLPCVVDVARFEYKPEARNRVRAELGLRDEDIVGIYAGKYGGLYYDEEAFKLYQALFRIVGSALFLILLTETDQNIVMNRVLQFGLPLDRIRVLRVSHAEVPAYLSAADFGISTIKSVPAMRYCSAIKHGEYWAADLPIVSTLAFGDDAEIIRSRDGGVVVDNLDDADDVLKVAVGRLGERNSGRYSKLAREYRDSSFLDTAIDFAFQRLGYSKDRPYRS